ncbi:unnamed protein product [Taenia asiatica]|uniref:Ig-like domain-containing protein n=1 Tax=Taenia asiatica TaxID=60517 RepID=A0A158R8D4_TAEAS|nr:unnamed protein product [Taenia asiatica]
MHCHVYLVLLASLGCLTKVEAEFTFDGPFSHDVLIGGLVDLPCYTSTDAKRLVLTAFSGSGINRNSLRWIHRRWNRIVDPWSGDGRRTYLEMSVSQRSDGIAESMGIFKIPMVSGVGLRVLAANPSDAGQYACLLCKRTFDQGLTVDMKTATLLSIHSIRVTEAKSSGNEEEEEEEEESADATKTKAIGTHPKKGSKNSDGKGTFFDAWTWQIDSSAFHGPDTTVFKIDCYTDIALVGLILRGTDVSTVRVGWKFTPRGNPIVDESMITSDEPWDLLASERLCHPEESQLCEGDGGVRAEGSTTAGRVLGSWDLDTVLHEATNQVWKARWLRVTPETAFGSGTWQCWLEGPNLFKNKTIRERKNKREHMLISEVRVFEFAGTELGWFYSVEVWRVMATWAAPTCYLLFYLLIAISWAAAMHWRHLLYRRPHLPKKAKKSKASEGWSRRRRGWRGPLVEEADAQKPVQTANNPYDFEETNYTKIFLTKHGIHSQNSDSHLQEN